MVLSLWQRVQQFFKKLNINSPNSQPIPLLRITRDRKSIIGCPGLGVGMKVNCKRAQRILYGRWLHHSVGLLNTTEFYFQQVNGQILQYVTCMWQCSCLKQKRGRIGSLKARLLIPEAMENIRELNNGMSLDTHFIGLLFCSFLLF